MRVNKVRGPVCRAKHFESYLMEMGSREMSIRKIICLLLCLVLLVGATACSPGGSTDGDSTGEPGSASTSKPAKGTKKETIVFWNMYWGNDKFADLCQELVDEYNDTHDGPAVELQMRPWATYFQDYLTAVTTGNAPDVACGSGDNSLLYGRMDELVDLTDIADAWKEDGFYDTFPAGSFELHNIDGCQYGIPWIIDARCMFVNLEMFEQAGVTIPDRGYFTFDELYQACKKLKAAGIEPMVLVGTDFMNDQCINYLTVAAGGSHGVDANIQADVNSPRNMEVYNWIHKMVEEGLIAEESLGFTADQQIGVFAADSCAIIISNLERITSPSKYGKKYDVLPAPVWNEGDPVRNIAYINPMVVFSQTSYPEECKEFVKWWVENNGILFEEGAANFSASSQINSSDAMMKNPRNRAIIEKILPHTTYYTYPCEHLFNAVVPLGGEAHLGHMFAELLENKSSVQAIADKYQAIVEQLIEENPEP